MGLYPDPVVRRLQWARWIRSVAQGIGVVDVALYLNALHWSAVAIGGVLAASAVMGAVLIAAVGPLSDRFGRRPFLLAYDGLVVAGIFALLAFPVPPVITAALVVTGLGRGQNGSAGPFTPAEQAWMASRVPGRERGMVFSANNAVAFFGMGVGAILAGAPHWWAARLAGPERFLPVFALVGLCSLVVWIILWATPEVRVTRRPQAAEGVRREENRRLGRLALTTGLNGFAQGFTGPLISYWFATRYHASTAAVGLTLAASFFATGLAAFGAGRLTGRFGSVRVVAVLQAASGLLVVLLPWMPTLAAAAALNAVRAALVRGGQGARAAVSTSLTRDERRGLALSVNALAFRTSSAAGPPIAGALWEAGWAEAPFAVTAVLQLAGAWLYWRWFRQQEPRAAQPLEEVPSS
ncbi:MAG: MFS transporter [Firmicutes bacterium]|nr:MFS transporter [Alicyclobacillaceae bacterium]MCL6497047.1 MFS transporter [Bacillota bacterium]